MPPWWFIPDWWLKAVNDCHIISGCSFRAFPLILNKIAAKKKKKKPQEERRNGLQGLVCVLGWGWGCSTPQRHHLAICMGGEPVLSWAARQLWLSRFRGGSISPLQVPAVGEESALQADVSVSDSSSLSSTLWGFPHLLPQQCFWNKIKQGQN